MLKKFLAVTAIGLFASAAHADILVNGDFETGVFGPAWTATGNVNVSGPAGPAYYFGGGNTAQDGKALVAFNGGNQPSNAVLTQTFATSAGSTYLVQFDFGATSGGNPQQFTADIIDDAMAVLGSTTVIGMQGALLKTATFSFVADGSMTTLRFTDFVGNNSTNQDGLLDNVSVTAVPEPTTVALLGLGLMGFAMSRRKAAK